MWRSLTSHRLKPCGFYAPLDKTQPNYDNKGKTALISGKDSCIVLSEDKEFWFKSHPKQIRVLYKDNYGKYVEQEFQAEMITIIK
jgi:hypothetical protein